MTGNLLSSFKSASSLGATNCSVNIFAKIAKTLTNINHSYQLNNFENVSPCSKCRDFISRLLLSNWTNQLLSYQVRVSNPNLLGPKRSFCCGWTIGLLIINLDMTLKWTIALRHYL